MNVQTDVCMLFYQMSIRWSVFSCIPFENLAAAERRSKSMTCKALTAPLYSPVQSCVSHFLASLCLWWRALNQPSAAVSLSHVRFFSVQVWQLAGEAVSRAGRQALPPSLCSLSHIGVSQLLASLCLWWRAPNQQSVAVRLAHTRFF